VGPEQDLSFRTLEDALQNPPVMCYTDFSQPFYVTCDASHFSCSYNLSQMIDGKEQMIAYGTRGFRKHELNWPINDKELIAIIMAVTQCHEYLQPKKFFIRTVHKSLQYLMSTKHCTGRLSRWARLLSNYNFKIIHIKGKNNTVADNLSRIPFPEPETRPEVQLDELLFAIDDSLIEQPSRERKKQRKLLEINFKPDAAVQPTAVCNVESTEDDTVRDEMIEHDLFAQHDIQASQWKCPACMNIIAYPHDEILLTDDESLAKKVVA